ncbi:MAG: pyridoxamine 5'-phosphate oxidase family protein [Deltaproteobacteria bacterium]|nr:pyridoxamine 5'-phosphate oxidase family protein [Deltaproteobacteria bacterium]MBW1978480.1 pyridoxamine 5'-phosphate oxidase family protein [Deltaproteobacteria bacterium]MBW2044400.1 pyridoxamine 5'-phosphate oxidase family protein [Deltaproteobacteria bacterium]MBW2301684.1 pyridoxamine 5'-phosphate oxidase family protein [Deltaproteobacteria bacterium]RLB32329.1 MAG: pyridoxamine 5'-phosphate oxidase family protein [Deltaproteobacteria bacterium]
MRRKEKEVTDPAEIDSIILKASVCRVAMFADGYPYIVPLCFGYKEKTLYFHTASEGKKLEIIGKNPRVCFEIDIDHELTESDKACNWGMKYRSVIGFGKASVVDDLEEKQEALDTIMSHYSTRRPFSYNKKAFKKTTVLRIDVESMTGKKSGY